MDWPKWAKNGWPQNGIGQNTMAKKWTGHNWIGPKRSSPLGRRAQGIRAEPREDDNLCKLLVLVEASRESLGLAIVGFQEGHRMALLPLSVAATNCLYAQPLGSPRVVRRHVMLWPVSARHRQGAQPECQ